MQIVNRMKLFSSIAALVLASGFTQVAQAGTIPYANSGTYNTATYSFTATNTGDVVAYIVAGFNTATSEHNQVGLLINGVLSTAGYGFSNDNIFITGASFNFGSVNAGDILTFVNHNSGSTFLDLYSNASLNVGYDSNGDGLNHIYSTAYNGIGLGVLDFFKLTGAYVGFENAQFPASDYNYNDQSFVFTNTTVTTVTSVTDITPVAVPEPPTLLLFGLGLLGFAAMRRRAMK